MSKLLWLIVIAAIAFILWKHFKGDSSELPAIQPIKKNNKMVSPAAPVNPITSQFSWITKIF